MKILRFLLVASFLATSVSTASAQVNQTWEQRYDGPAQSDDFVEAMTVDSTGCAYVVGGTREFVAPNSLVPRFLTIKYDRDGNELWTRLFKAGPPNLDASLAQAVVVDSNGDVLVAGSVTSSKDWGLVKYDSDGNELWSRTYALGSLSLVYPEAVAVDGSNNVYMSGYFGGTATTVKYDSAGNFQWDLKYNGVGSGASTAAMVVDPAGNAYVAGGITVPGLGTEFAVHKIDPGGNVLWMHTSGYPGSGLDLATALAIDAAGDIVVAGDMGGNTVLGPDLAVVKLSSAGAVIWQRTWDGPAGSADGATSMALDGKGAAIVAGYTRTSPGDYDAVVVKFDASGALQWGNVYAGGALFSDYAWDVGVDPAGNVVLVGDAVPLTGSNHYFAVGYGPDGNQQWEELYGGPLNGNSFARALAMDGAAFYVTGESDNFGFDSDIATLRYEPAGPSIYCTSQVNSQGCVPSIGFSGTPSASAGSGFDLTVVELINNKPGLFFYSKTGAQSVPALGGTLCATPPLWRATLQGSGGNPPPDDCSGSIVFDFNSWIASGADPDLVPGQSVWTQYWSRDPAAVGTSSNLSDALTFTIQN